MTFMKAKRSGAWCAGHTVNLVFSCIFFIVHVGITLTSAE